MLVDVAAQGDEFLQGGVAQTFQSASPAAGLMNYVAC
jgi:hypothetical protein